MPSPVCFLEREGKALYGITSVFCRDITDQLLDQNGLSYTGTSKQSDFTSLGIGRQKTPPAVRQTGPYLWFPAMYFCG